MKINFSAFIVFFTTISLLSCKIIRPIAYNLPGEKDAKRFPYRTILQAPLSSIFYFMKYAETPECIHDIKVENKAIYTTGIPLNEFVKLHKTVLFVIKRNDSILYEYYDDDYSAQTNVTSFSIAKSFITMLIGIAIDEG